LLKRTTATIISVVTYPGLLDRPLPPPAPATADLAETVADDWVARIQAGDSRAFEALYLAFYAPLCAFVATIVGNPAQSEDIVQDLLCRIWERREAWRPSNGGARRYLFGAARNRALNHLKRERIEARAADVFPIEGDATTPERFAEARDFSAALSRALADLPPRCRQACILRWRYGLTYPEIAGAMGVTQKAVEALLTRGLKALRAALIAFDM
jgi:RNA polymerase sigma-70 factor (family 1)